jgi:uncharacterized protein (DUF927 family)
MANEAGGGLHFKGSSQCGKTTILLCAGSVWGGGGLNGFLASWRTTANGLEGVAESHCDALLCLDELGQIVAREAGEVAYMLANGSGKLRARRDGSPRPSTQWRLLFISSGEISLADKMGEIGKQPRGGQEVRLIDIKGKPSKGYGAFETLHGAKMSWTFAANLGGQ